MGSASGRPASPPPATVRARAALLPCRERAGPCSDACSASGSRGTHRPSRRLGAAARGRSGAAGSRGTRPPCRVLDEAARGQAGGGGETARVAPRAPVRAGRRSGGARIDGTGRRPAMSLPTGRLTGRIPDLPVAPARVWPGRGQGFPTTAARARTGLPHEGPPQTRAGSPHEHPLGGGQGCPTETARETDGRRATTWGRTGSPHEHLLVGRAGLPLEGHGRPGGTAPQSAGPRRRRATPRRLSRHRSRHRGPPGGADAESAGRSRVHPGCTCWDSGPSRRTGVRTGIWSSGHIRTLSQQGRTEPVRGSAIPLKGRPAGPPTAARRTPRLEPDRRTG